MTEKSELWSFSIRYEGGDADTHTIDLNQLGLSLQGFARVLAVSAHFIETGKYNKQFDALSVKVVAAPVPEHHCYEIMAQINQLASSKELWSGLGTALFMAVVGYVFNRRKEEEMKHLSDALKQSIGNNADAQLRLIATVEKLADALRPSVRQALAPVGTSVASINIRPSDERLSPVVLDEVTKAMSQADKDNVILPSQEYQGVITELDMLTGACKVSISDDSESRIPATVTDPLVKRPENAYATAMSKIATIRFVAKAEVDADGDLVRLYISDIVP
jgi:hypothetical protein